MAGSERLHLDQSERAPRLTLTSELDETQSSAPRPTSRLLSAEGHGVRTPDTCANLRTRSLRHAPRCVRARAAHQGAYGHKAGV